MKTKEVTNKDYFSILWQGKWLIILTSLIAASIVLSIYFLAPRSYQGSFIVTLRGANSMTVGGMSSNTRPSAFIADVINQPFFAELALSKTKSLKKQKSLFDFLSGQQLISRADLESNIVYVYAYGRTASETKELADRSIEILKAQIKTISTGSSEKIKKEINKEILDPLVKKIDEMSAKVENARLKKAKNIKTNIEIARLRREISLLQNKRNKLEDYLVDVTLFDMASGPRLEVVMNPVVSRSSTTNIMIQMFSAGLIGFIFGLLLVLIKDFVKGTKPATNNDKNNS